jgi:hypothetical protein
MPPLPLKKHLGMLGAAQHDGVRLGVEVPREELREERRRRGGHFGGLSSAAAA